MSKPGIVVLGAGPAGLAFAHQYGSGAIVLERTSDVGGLSRTIEIGEGVFDIGGHSFHTPHQTVKDLVSRLMGDSVYEQARDARVWFDGELIPYPFQHHYEALTNADIVEACRDHEPDSARISDSRNFEEWILNRFGPGVSKHFMLPYNRKLWARDLKEMTFDWVGQRVATDKSIASSDKSSRPERRPLLSESRVAYPLEGGFGAIFKRLATQCERIELSQDIVSVDVDERIARSRSGQVWPWDRLVSTIPLPLLLNIITTTPDHLRRLASNLEAVSLKILMLLIKAPTTPVPQRIYIADEHVPPHKVAFNHTSSPNLMRRAHHAITCEVSYSSTKPAEADDTSVEKTKSWLKESGFISNEDDVVSTRVLDVPFGYPVNTHKKDGIVSEIRRYLEGYGIHSIGRFGAWDYVNSDECIRQGLDLARKVSEAPVQ
jgi:protoporphyrinogen oxidase